RCQYFQGDDAIQRPVPCLVDTAHPTAAQLFEDHILIQDEAIGPADQDALGLETGQQALLDEGTGKEAAAPGLGQDSLGLCQLGDGEQSAATQVAEEGTAADVRGDHDYRPVGGILPRSDEEVFGLDGGTPPWGEACAAGKRSSLFKLSTYEVGKRSLPQAGLRQSFSAQVGGISVGWDVRQPRS